MFEFIKNRFGSGKSSETSEIEWEQRTNAGIAARFVRGLDINGDPDSQRIQSPYQQHVAVFRCVHTIATSISQVPFGLYKGDKLIDNGPVYDLIQRPNQLMSWVEFISATMTNLHVYGNAFVYIDERDSKGVPLGLYPIPPRMVRAVRGKMMYELTRWEIVTSHNQVTEVDPKDMLHIWYASNPEDPILGIGPMQVAWLIINTDYQAAVYNQSVLRSGGIPAGILSYKGPGRLTEEMKDEVRSSWQRTYGGPTSGSKLAVVNNDWAWQLTGAMNRDMEFLDTRKWNLADISRAFNVPLMYLNDQEKSGLGDAGLRVTQKQFYNENIVPLGRKFEAIINEKFISKIDSSIYGRFDFGKVEALRDDYVKKVEAAEKLSKMGFTINMINAKLGLDMDNVPHGDDHFVLNNMTTAQDVLDKKVEMPSKSQKELELAEKQAEEKAKALKESAKQIGDEDQAQKVVVEKEEQKKITKKEDSKKSALWLHATEKVSEIKDRCEGKLRREFMRQRSDVLSAIDRRISADYMINTKRIAEAIAQFVVPAYIEGFETADRENDFEFAADDVKVGAGLYVEAIYEELLTIGRELSSIIDKEIAGSNYDSELAARKVRDVFNKITKRSELIARGYIFRAFNVGRYYVLVEKESIKWVCSPDPECDHATNDGQIVRRSETFPSGHTHPGDIGKQVTIGCDCIAVAA